MPATTKYTYTIYDVDPATQSGGAIEDYEDVEVTGYAPVGVLHEARGAAQTIGAAYYEPGDMLWIVVRDEEDIVGQEVITVEGEVG